MNDFYHAADKSKLFTFVSFFLYPGLLIFLRLAQFKIGLLIMMQPSRLLEMAYGEDSRDFNPFCSLWKVKYI